MIPEIDSDQFKKDFEALSGFGAEPQGGVHRVAFSTADMEARAWIERRMGELGMVVRTDPAGNNIGVYAGREKLPAIALGSHGDSVPHGGRFDGALGVVAALSCIAALQRAEVRLRRPLEVINFAGEEVTMAGGTFGSQAMTGTLDLNRFNQPAWDGRPVADHLRSAGLNPASVLQALRPRGSLKAYLEMHIEQGGTLAGAGIPIGIVEGIVGIRRYAAVFHGTANHAGTTPMELRRDALVGAARFILQIRDAAVAHGVVGTVGALKVHPGAPNVIPGQVDLEAEIRGMDESVLDRIEPELASLARQSGGEFRRYSAKEPVRSDPVLLEAFVSAADELGLKYKMMSSGAGHDAMCIAALAPQAMLFVPSREGISHSPDEFTIWDHCLAGANVLLRAILKLDGTL